MGAGKDVIKIPMRVFYKIGGEKPEKITAEYEEIPTDVIAGFFVKKFGITDRFREREAKM